MNKRFNLFPNFAPAPKDPPAWQEGLCAADSRPLPADKRPESIHPAGVSVPPRGSTSPGWGRSKRRESAESRSGNTAPREPRLWGRGRGMPEAAGCGGAEAGLLGRAGRPASPLPTARPLASSVARVSGPKRGGCQRLTSPLPAAGSGVGEGGTAERL